MAGPAGTFCRYTRAPAIRLATMETRVKERLVGAVILVALIVALVPEILSGPRRPTTAGGASNSEQPLRTYTIDLAEQGFPAERTESRRNERTDDAAKPMAPEGSGSTSTDRIIAATTPARTQAAAPAAPASARAALTSPTIAESGSVKGWAVQLGSFSNAKNAERLAAELRARGYKAFVSRYESAGQSRLRVRVGPEHQRARAEQLAARLRREGRPATVVAQP